MRNLKLLLAITTLLFFSCKAQKSPRTKVNKQNNNSIGSNSLTPMSAQNQFRFIVSFYSKGGGTDHKINEAYIKFVKEYEQKKGVTLSKENIVWGKEGESDLCFKLTELSANNQIEFINASKDLLKTSDLVLTEENVLCKHKN